MSIPNWWVRPRTISVVVDNDSWVLPYAGRIVDGAIGRGDDAALIRHHDDVREGSVAFYLGCVKITPPAVLARNRCNLVVHASELPKGRGFSPLVWQVLEGGNRIPVCLLEAVQEVDAGPVIYRDYIAFEGHELNDEMRAALGDMHVELCTRFLDAPEPPAGTAQQGAPSRYARRRPVDSRLDPERSIASQFDLLRVVDNERYPAFFDLRGHRYVVRIEKASDGDPR
jgi:methionyl-tRNA formyltransferase